MLPAEIAPADFCALSDAFTAMVLALRGSPNTGFGTGLGIATPIGDDYGLSKAARLYEQAILGLHHFPTQARMAPNAHRLTTKTGDLVSALLREQLRDLSNATSSVSIPNAKKFQHIVDYVTFFNTGSGGPWNALVSSVFASAYEEFFRTVKFGPMNVYGPAIEIMAQVSLGGAILSVESVDPTVSAGVEIEANIAGYAGVPGIVTVIGSARTEFGGIVKDTRQWSASVTGDGAFVMVPDVPGDLCLDIRQITLPLGCTAGTATIAGLLPVRLRNGNSGSN